MTFAKKMIEAIIFDLDGTLIDSEPCWMEAGREVLKEEGLMLTEKDMEPTEGLNTRDMVMMFYPRLINKSKSLEEITKKIDNRAEKKILRKGSLQPGAKEMIELLRQYSLPLAIASSTVNRLIKSFLHNFGLESYFKVICSAESEPFGKPHPGIYLTTAKKLNVSPQRCLVIEDSFQGMLAAKAAGMKLLAYLPKQRYCDTKYDFADSKIESFCNFGPSELEYLHSIV